MRAVLVVEDEVDLVATYERLLRRQGYRIIPAGTQRGALEKLGSETFTLVVTDLRLPDGDGIEIIRAARALHVPPPVIVATGYASEAGRRQALGAGASAYIAKPFAVSEFSDLVGRLVDPFG
jgi:two-component system response regulator PilR (NtrC family)